MEKLMKSRGSLFNVRLWTFFMFVITMIALNLSSNTLGAEPQRGGTMRVAIATPPRSLDPHVVTRTDEVQILNNIYNRLMRWDSELTVLKPELIESFVQSDEYTIVFKIRKGVHFHDVPPVNGRELTSEDVKYSVERSAGEHGKGKFMTRNRARFKGKIDSITTPDRYTVIFKTKEPYAPFLHYVAETMVIPREAVEKFGDLKMNAIGTGPFIMKEYVRGSHMIQERNPKYFKEGLPYLDKIHYRDIGSPSARLSAYLAGKLDRIGLQHYQIPTIEKESPETTIIRRPGLMQMVLRVQPADDTHPLKPPFDSKKVRQAISMAIDKRKLLKLALDNHGNVMVGPVINWPPYSLTDKDQVEYNPEKARKYLAEAGYPNGFKTEMITWNLSYMTKPAQIIKEMLKEVGIDIELNALPTAQYFNRAYRFKYDMSLHIMVNRDDPEHGIVGHMGRYSTYYRWKNDEIWKLVDEQGRTLDPKKRLAMIHDIQRKIIEDSPYTFLYALDQYHAFGPQVFPKEFPLDPYQFTYEKYWIAK